MAEARPEEKVRRKFLARYERGALVCIVNVDTFISEQAFTMENSRQISALSAVILIAKNWPFVISCQRNGIIFRFIFAGYLPSYH